MNDAGAVLTCMQKNGALLQIANESALPTLISQCREKVSENTIFPENDTRQIFKLVLPIQSSRENRYTKRLGADSRANFYICRMPFPEKSLKFTLR
ncbi:hypothetical protein [Lacticaseibacillus sp. GG6-2]